MLKCRKLVVLGAILLSACNPMRGCVESNYQLSPESRLPKWLLLPPGVSRENASVKLAFYAPPLSSADNVDVDLVDRAGHRLAHATGRAITHPRSSDTSTYWRIIIVNGVMEVLEFRPVNDVFHVTDDAALVQQAKDFVVPP